MKSIYGYAASGDLRNVINCVKLGNDINDALEPASYYGHYKVVEWLMEQGVDPYYGGGVALLVSYVRCHYETNRLLNRYLRQYKLKKIMSNI